jgi:hypothetical protein
VGDCHHILLSRSSSDVPLVRYSGGHETPGEQLPSLTPEGQKKYDTEKPGYGPKAAPGGNDPILQCDPIGFPRILFFPTPLEFAEIPGRTLQFFERDHAWREIWTDGRSMPKDMDPTWYGYALGKWTDDSTFVADTAGLDDRTWMGAFGVPHSEQLRVHESHHRTDRNTIEFAITMDDPETYTKPWVGAPRILKLQPKAEIPQYFCVWSEENSFAERIRALGAKDVKGGGSFAQPSN